MIESMTGFGEADALEDGVQFHVEIRSVNNRYFKASIKLPEHLQRFEHAVDKLLRTRVSRGSVSYSLRTRDNNAPSPYEINTAALAGILSQLKLATGGHSSTTIDLAGLLELPGICEPIRLDEPVLNARWKVVHQATDAALDQLIRMRRSEGAALRGDLDRQCAEIRRGIGEIARRAPQVVQDYHARLAARVAQLLNSGTAELDRDALAREVAIFADRCDVNEELARLESHLDQFARLCDAPEETGRKLDFVAQEMLREANTIGSKANDALIARSVVEIKSAVDRIKEQVQNIG
jgi:uncharacterized protein (TIGR00255 family)